MKSRWRRLSSMEKLPYRFKDILAATIAIFLLAFSFNAHACLVPLPGASDTSMANGCSTPLEQPARQLCDVFKTLSIEMSSQSDSLLGDPHILADHAVTASLTESRRSHGLFHGTHVFDLSSPPHQSVTTTVLRI